MEKKKNKSVLLVGPGKMGREYAKILIDMKLPLEIVGIEDKSSIEFEKLTLLPVYKKGIDNWLAETEEYPQFAIVSVINQDLGNVARSLIQAGLKNILLEKPGGLDIPDIGAVAKEAEKNKTNVFLGYNRRFYTSTLKAKQIIKEDGGVKSFFFEFTEWSHVMETYPLIPEVKKNWLLHNSTHVIDLAFYLGGKPKELYSLKTGTLSWHPIGSTFTGAGKTEEGALFSYHSNWDAPGRWATEILTKKHRLIFKPLEKLKIQKKASVKIEEVKLNDKLDIDFKPGLYRQVDAFLNNNWSEFKNIHQQLKDLELYDTIRKGGVIKNQ